MKKFFLSIGLIAALAVTSVQAASTSVSVAGGSMTNFSLLINNAPLKVTQIIVSSAGTNLVNVGFVDTFTNQLGYTNAAYTNSLTYVTNFVSVWTNYYGVTNTVTNSASLVDITNNAVAATTNLFPIRFQIVTPTNSTYTVNSAGTYFNNGLWLTNTGGGTATVTINYQQ